MTVLPWSAPTIQEWASPAEPPHVPLVPPSGLRTVTPLIRYVSRLTHHPQRDLIGPYRDANLVKARHIVMWLARRFTERSLPEIGRALGCRDHTTIMHGCRKVERVIATVGLPDRDTPEDWARLLWARQWPRTGVLFQ